MQFLISENKKGASIIAYLFWMTIGFILGVVVFGSFLCKVWCGC